MAEKMQRYDEPTSTWIDVASVERVEVITGDEEWVYPAHWPQVDDCPARGIKLLIEIPSTAVNYYFEVSVATLGSTTYGAFSVDWGDGTSDSYIPAAALALNNLVHKFDAADSSAVSPDGTCKYFAIEIVPTGAYELRGLQWRQNEQTQQDVVASCFRALNNPEYGYADYYATYQDCSKLKYVSMRNASSNLTLAKGYNGFFQGCRNLEVLNIPEDIGRISTLEDTFFMCYSLKNIDFSKCENQLYAINLGIYDCTSLKSLSNVKPPTLPDGSILLAAVKAHGNFNLEDAVVPTWKCHSLLLAGCPKLKDFEVDSSIMSSTASMFNRCSVLKSAKFNGGLSSVTTASAMFQECGLRDFDFENANFVNLLNASQMFMMSNLHTIDLSLATKLNDVNQMCYNNTRLKTITLPSTATATQIRTDSIFRGCVALETVINPSPIFSHTHSTQSYNFYFAFEKCKSLVSLDLSDWNVDNTALYNVSPFYMFDGCSELTSVIIGGGINPKLSSINYMFQNCPKLETVTFGPTVATSCVSSSYTFLNCRSLDTVIGLDAFRYVADATSMFAVSGTTPGGLASLSADLFASAATSVNMTNTFSNTRITDINLPGAKVTRIGAQYLYGSTEKPLESLLVSASSPFSGSSPQIDISYTTATDAQLDDIFTNLPTVTGKTINITGATGAATCTRSIATAKGWSVTG